MAGRWPGKKYWDRIARVENQPPRSARGGGRKGCLGSDNDPYPGVYHVKNCSQYGNGKKTWWDQLKNQRY